MIVSAGDKITDTVTRGTRPDVLCTSCGRITLSAPGKMPGSAYGFPARITCPAAKQTIRDHGTDAVCSSCYAMAGRYVTDVVQQAYHRRFRFFQTNIQAGRPDIVVDALVYLIRRATRNDPVFRVSDSGDLYRPEVANIWGDIADRLPDVRRLLFDGGENGGPQKKVVLTCHRTGGNTASTLDAVLKCGDRSAIAAQEEIMRLLFFVWL